MNRTANILIAVAAIVKEIMWQICQRSLYQEGLGQVPADFLAKNS
jgi:hypothetical protein